MKLISTVLLLLILAVKMDGQPSISMQVIASAGGYSAGEAGSISWTMGETFTATHSAGDFFITEGFQQPDLSHTVSAKIPENKDFHIKVYPNPAIDYVRVEWNTKTESDIHVELYDLTGRRISHKKSDNEVSYIQLDLQSVQRSAYLIKVYSDDRQFSRTFRIIKY